MSNINKPNTFSSGTTISSSDVNDNFDTIYNDYNGNITSTNLADDAVSTSKIADGAVTAAKLASGIVESGWVSTSAPNTVSANGNRSYDLTFNSIDLTGTLSKGMRLKLTRTVTAPTQCTTLNGSTQYWTKVTPTGTLSTVTNNWSIVGWVKLSNYTNTQPIGGRGDAALNNAFYAQISGTSGTVEVGIRNGGSANLRYALTNTSVPLNKWVHIACTYTSGTITVYFDGISQQMQSSVAGGTNPTVAGTGGDFSVGRIGAYVTNLFGGKICQVGVFDAVISQATVRALMNQTLSGSETNNIGAWSFNNTTNDLNAAGNNLSAGGSAVATTVDAPFTQDVTNTSITAGTTNYAIITKASFSTNTTLTVQVPEGDTLPTSGGISAVSYSTQKVPYGFPIQKGKWRVKVIHKIRMMQSSPTISQWYNLTAATGVSGASYIYIPAGEWNYGYEASMYATRTGSATVNQYITISTANNTESDKEMTSRLNLSVNSAVDGSASYSAKKESEISTTSLTVYYLNNMTDTSQAAISTLSDQVPTIIYADLAYL